MKFKENLINIERLWCNFENLFMRQKILIPNGDVRMVFGVDRSKLVEGFLYINDDVHTQLDNYSKKNQIMFFDFQKNRINKSNKK